jgi:hypothetical protein
MFKIFKIIILIVLLFITIDDKTFSNYLNNEQVFIVTAYYSPLPNQNFYITGTYSGDILLN